MLIKVAPGRYVTNSQCMNRHWCFPFRVSWVFAVHFKPEHWFSSRWSYGDRSSFIHHFCRWIVCAHNIFREFESSDPCRALCVSISAVGLTTEVPRNCVGHSEYCRRISEMEFEIWQPYTLKIVPKSAVSVVSDDGLVTLGGRASAETLLIRCIIVPCMLTHSRPWFGFHFPLPSMMNIPKVLTLCYRYHLKYRLWFNDIGIRNYHVT